MSQTRLNNLGAVTLLIVLIILLCYVYLHWPEPARCDTDSEVYLALLENKDNWLAHFDDLPSSSLNGFNITLNRGLYVVQSLYKTSDGQPIVSIAIAQEIPRTLLGRIGYYYTPTGELGQIVEDDRYSIEQLSDNIYCYTKIR